MTQGPVDNATSMPHEAPTAINESSPDVSASDYRPTVSLRRAAMSGTIWTMLGQVGRQGVRIISSLVLTRLLFPEAYGLVAIVGFIMSGVQMFSDTGVNAAIIQNKRGGTDEFINTAWTIQVVRSFFLYAILVVLAYPMALIYEQPPLTVLIIVAGVSTIIGGFSSTGMLRLHRQVSIRPIVIRDLVSQMVGLAVMIPWAYLAPSVWVLIGGGIAAALANTAMSFWLTPGSKPHLAWDKSVAREIFLFGRWLFISTGVTFLFQRGDAMVLGKLVDPAMLGIYTVAVTWSRGVLELINKLGNQVLFPLYSHLANHSRDRLRSQVFKARLVILAVALPVTWFFVLFGDHFISFMYDERYHEAGWILRILAVGVGGQIIVFTGANVILSVGDSFRQMVYQLVCGTCLIGGMLLGYHFDDLQGFVISLALIPIVQYVCMAWAVNKHGVWLPLLDLPAFALTFLVAGLGWWLMPS